MTTNDSRLKHISDLVNTIVDYSLLLYADSAYAGHLCCMWANYVIGMLGCIDIINVIRPGYEISNDP